MQKLIDGSSEPEAPPVAPRGHRRPRIEIYLSAEERAAVEAAMVKEVLDRGETWEPGGVNTLGNFIRRAAFEMADIIEGNGRPTRFPGVAARPARRVTNRTGRETKTPVPETQGVSGPSRTPAGALRVSCPECGAKRGWPCVLKDGAHRIQPHPARVTVANARQKP